MNQKIVYKPFNLALKIPEQWHEKLASLAEEKQVSLKELMIQVISQYLDDNVAQHNAEKSPQQSDKLYSELNDRINILESKTPQIEDLKERFEIMEKLIDSLQRQVTIRDHAKPLPDYLIDHSHDEDLHDEPDEILTDFLD